MRCTYCGVDIEQDSKFCTNCGKEVVPSTNEQPENNGTLPENPATESQVVMAQPVQGQPIIQEQTMIQTPQMGQFQQPQQASQKKNNTILIVIGIVVGAIVLFGILGIVILSITLSTISNNLENEDPIIFDYGDNDDYDNLEDGKVIKKIKDPTGHEIILMEDRVYIVRTETGYLYDVARELREKAIIKTKEEVDELEASEIEKLATKKAIDYLSNSSYSIKDLKEKLVNDNFEEKTVEFAIENCGVDWAEQTKIKAVEILAAGGFSRKNLISLLEYEGYDEDLAKKAAEDEMMNYYEQAVYHACFYKYTEKKYDGSYSRQDAERMLKNNGYKDEEVRFALTKIYDEMDD